MVLRGLSVVIVFSLFSVAWAETALTPEQALLGARAALEKGDRVSALQFYAKIPLKHALWKEKIEDLVRYEILNKNPEEAWRIVQIEKRVFGGASRLADYERLAIFRARACSLSLEGRDKLQQDLVSAAIYRFAETNLGLRERAELAPIDGASLATGLTPYLADIPSSRLQYGRGCRVERLETRTMARAARHEMEHLLAASTQLASTDLPSLLLRARMLELSSELRDAKLTKALEDRIPPESMIRWLELPDLERRRFFAHFFRGRRLAEVSESLRKRASEIAVQVLRGDLSAHVESWLAMVSLEGLPLAERADLLGHIERNWHFKGRAWVLFSLAQSRYELGQASEALTVLRRLLLEREEEAAADIEDAAVDLAARIFAEYRFEDRLVGAMRAALPSRLWIEMLDGALIMAAVGGRSAEFAKLMKLERHNPESFRAKELDLWRSLAERRHARFLAQIRKLGRGPGADRALIELGGRFASELIANPDLRSLKDFARSLAAELRTRLRPGDTRQDEVSNLAQILEDESEWVEGARAVRQGVLSVGVVRWSQDQVKAPEFQFEVPSHLPLRELVMIPDRATGRAWVLSTERR